MIMNKDKREVVSRPNTVKARRYAQTSNSENSTFQENLDNRDYIGALTMLDHQTEEMSEKDKLNWKAYISYQICDYSTAQCIYNDLLTSGKHGVPSSECRLNLACVYFKLQMWKEAEEMALDISENSPLKNRLLYHIAYHRSNRGKVEAIEYKLNNENADDCISKAAMQYQIGNYQEAIDILKNVIAEYTNYDAINFYIALCYFKLDYYDVAMDIITVYLQRFPDSVLAKNLKACLQFKVYDGLTAQDELRELNQKVHIFESNDILRHNMVVFTGGEKAAEVLPPLIETIPEAKLNLAIHYLNQHKIIEAYDIMNSFEPTGPLEFTLKGISLAMEGQRTNNKQLVHQAHDHLQTVGQSPIDCDTILGRQCMASFLFLEKKFDEANIYFNSISSFLDDDDDFNWNYGISLAASRDYENAERILLRIEDDSLKRNHIFSCWFTKCLIANEKPDKAWNKFLKDADRHNDSENELLLKLIGNDSYYYGYFTVAVKAFDKLSKTTDDTFLYWEPLRGACVGAFQKFIAQIQGRIETHNIEIKTREKELLQSISTLRSFKNPQAEHIAMTMISWLQSNSKDIQAKFSI